MTMTILCMGAGMVIVSGHSLKVEKKPSNPEKSSKISRNYLFLPF
jgi:hypothetical protein